MKGIFAACASMMMLFATTVQAESALVVSEGLCGLLDADGNIIAGEESHYVLSNNGKDGNYTVKCSIKGLDNPWGVAVRWDYESKPIRCFWPGSLLATTDWFEAISATGNATLTCKFHFSDL